jgi:ATP-dependent Clp protease ATP-binding subunit ClpA
MSEMMDAKWRSDENQDALADEAAEAAAEVERSYITDERLPKQLLEAADSVMVRGITADAAAMWLRRGSVAVQAARAELKKCNDDWNLRYQQWGATEDRLRAEIKSLHRFKASVDEALNTGDGKYKP